MRSSIIPEESRQIEYTQAYTDTQHMLTSAPSIPQQTTVKDTFDMLANVQSDEKASLGSSDKKELEFGKKKKAYEKYQQELQQEASQILQNLGAQQTEDRLRDKPIDESTKYVPKKSAREEKPLTKFQQKGYSNIDMDWSEQEDSYLHQ